MTATKALTLTERCVNSAHMLLHLDPSAGLTRDYLTAALSAQLSDDAVTILESPAHTAADLLTAHGLPATTAERISARDRRIIAAARLLSHTLDDSIASALPRRMHLVCDLVDTDYRMPPRDRIFPETAPADTAQGTLELPALLAS